MGDIAWAVGRRGWCCSYVLGDGMAAFLFMSGGMRLGLRVDWELLKLLLRPWFLSSERSCARLLERAFGVAAYVGLAWFCGSRVSPLWS